MCTILGSTFTLFTRLGNMHLWTSKVSPQKLLTSGCHSGDAPRDAHTKPLPSSTFHSSQMSQNVRLGAIVLLKFSFAALIYKIWSFQNLPADLVKMQFAVFQGKSSVWELLISLLTKNEFSLSPKNTSCYMHAIDLMNTENVWEERLENILRLSVTNLCSGVHKFPSRLICSKLACAWTGADSFHLGNIFIFYCFFPLYSVHSLGTLLYKLTRPNWPG